MAVDDKEIGEVRYGAAITIATIFRVLAFLTVVGGVITGIAGAANTSSSNDQSNEATLLTAYIAGVASVTIISAAVASLPGARHHHLAVPGDRRKGSIATVTPGSAPAPRPGLGPT